MNAWALRALAVCRGGLQPFVGPARAAEIVGYVYAVGTLLLYALVEQQRRAMLGLLWLLLTPALFLAVYLPIFSSAIDPGTSAQLGGEYSFSIYVMLGFVLWGAFMEGVQGGAASLVVNPSLIQHSPIPLSVLPFVKVLNGMAGFLVSALLMLAVLTAMGRWPGLRLLLFVPTVVLFASFAFGLAMLLSAVAVVFRDILLALSTILLIEFFSVPILYTPDMLGPRPRLFMELNPLTPYFHLLRATFLPQYPFEGRHLLLACAWSAGTLLVGRLVFRRLTSTLAEHV